MDFLHAACTSYKYAVPSPWKARVVAEGSRTEAAATIAVDSFIWIRDAVFRDGQSYQNAGRPTGVEIDQAAGESDSGCDGICSSYWKAHISLPVTPNRSASASPENRHMRRMHAWACLRE